MQNEVVCMQPASFAHSAHSAHSFGVKKCSVHRPSLAGTRERESDLLPSDRSKQARSKRRTGGLALAELLVGRPPDPPTLFRQAQKTTLAHFSA